MFRIRTQNRSHLDMWNARMNRPNTHPIVDSVVVALLKLQGVEQIDYSPRSIYDPKQLFSVLQLYDPDVASPIDYTCRSVRRGLREANRLFSKPSASQYLNAVSLEGPMSKIFHLLSVKGDKSAGLTAYGQTKLEAFPTGMRKATAQLRGERGPEPCLAGYRTQDDDKTRLVWGFPLSMTILEGIVARPLIENFTQTHCTPMCFAKPSSLIGMQMRKASIFNSHYVSMDASKFDTTIQAGVIHACFEALRTWFNLEQRIYKDVTVGRVFDIVENYFIHTPIVMPGPDKPCLYSGKRHGVPSGSYFTQIVDSYANTAMAFALSDEFNLNIHDDEIFVLGDDLLLFTNSEPNLPKYAQFLTDKFHMRMNLKKSVSGNSSDRIHFLGREWVAGVPVRSFANVVQRSVNPERYRDYGEDKTSGARLVLNSYGLTAMIEGMPPGFELGTYQLGNVLMKDQYVSGLTQYLIREGLIGQRMSRALH